MDLYVTRWYTVKHNLHVLNKFHDKNSRWVHHHLEKKIFCFKIAQNLHSVCNSARLIKLNKLHELPQRRDININVSCSLLLLNGVLCSVPIFVLPPPSLDWFLKTVATL